MKGLFGAGIGVTSHNTEPVNDLDGMVQQPVEAELDTSATDHRPDLADSLSGHHRELRVCLCASDPPQGTVAGRPAVRYQRRGESDLHTDSVWDAEPAIGSRGYSDRVGDDYLDDGGNLEALSLGRCGSSAILRVGVDCDRAATVDYMDELGFHDKQVIWPRDDK